MTTVFRGYEAVWDTPWNEKLTQATGYVEKVAHGPFREALAAGDNIPLLLEHDGHKLLATTQSGNLRLREDTYGAPRRREAPRQLPRAIRPQPRRERRPRRYEYGIALDLQRDSTLTRERGVWTRTITGVKRLLDVSLTWQPAYGAATARMRPAGAPATPPPEPVTRSAHVPHWESLARALERITC